MDMQRVTAVILGGGRGTRLRPLTRERSKPAVPLAGKYRLIDIPISNCINSNIRSIYVLTQFNSASLNQHVSQAYRFDQFSRGFVDVLAAEQTDHSGEWFQGTADAVRQSYPHLADEPSEYILILSGDHLYSMRYDHFLEKHIESGAEISVSVQPVTRREAPELGILKTDDEGRIVRFVEKPSADRLDELEVDTAALGYDEAKASERPLLGSMGIYLFNWRTLGEVLSSNPEFIDFGKEVIPHAIETRRVNAYLFGGYWADIGTVSAFFEANLDLCKSLPSFNLFDTLHPIYTNARYLPPAKLLGGLVEQCVIAEGAIVEGGIIKNSVLGVRSRIFRDVNMSEVVMLGADLYETSEEAFSEKPRLGIGEGSVIRRAIIDKNARIGKGVRLVNEKGVQEYEDPEERFVVRDGVIVIPKNAVVPHGLVF